MKQKKTGKREWSVTIPIAGRLVFSVEAESEEEAMEAAWAKFHESGEDGAEDIEWEAFEHITDGNCCRAPYNDIEADD